MSFADAALTLIEVGADGTACTHTPDAFAAYVAAADAWLSASGVSRGDAFAFTPRAALVDVALLAAAFARTSPVLVLHARGTPAEHARVVARAGRVTHVEPPPSLVPASPAAFAPGDPARRLVLVPTSGTTGEPKLVALSARAFLASAAASHARAPFISDEVALATLPLAHVGGLSLLVRTLLARATLVLPPPGPYDPVAIATIVDRLGVTQLSVVPTMLTRHLDGSALPTRGTLRRVLVGGAPAAPSLLARARGAGLPVRATYGLTEACSQVATQHDAADGGVGAPLPGVEVAITEDGRIAVRGPTLFDGYVVDGALDPARDRAGFFVTSDLGRLDARGHLHVEGRASDLIITGGENVMPAEVEAALVAIDGVREAVVFGLPDARWGERVVAAITLHGTDASGDAASIRTALADTLAAHKRPVDIHVVDALPLLPNGKVDRRALVMRFSR